MYHKNLQIKKKKEILIIIKIKQIILKIKIQKKIQQKEFITSRFNFKRTTQIILENIV